MAEVAKRITGGSASLGCDPELFVYDKDGNIIPSFVLLKNKKVNAGLGYIAQDGVQVELQPNTTYCRQEQASNMARLMANFYRMLPEGAKISFVSNVVIPKKQFVNFDVDARRLGCAPSLNVYGTPAIKVNQDTYRRRSAGGHLHFGSLPTTIVNLQAKVNEVKQPTEFAIKLVKTLDAFLGNTCVLIDQDPDAATRRRAYGRAGEYRLPDRSRLEYRTLSNFWMRAAYLQSMVYAIGRQAVGVVLQGDKNYVGSTAWDAYGELFSKLDEKKLKIAINKNDYNLAFENWQIVREFICKYYSSSSGIIAGNMYQFDAMLAQVKEQGLDSICPVDPVRHWVERENTYASHIQGFEAWLSRGWSVKKAKEA